MMQLTIDRDLCKKCLACRDVCPAGVIALDPADGFPVSTADAGELCIQCGHCVAVCPEAALTLPFMSPAECTACGHDVTAEQMERLILSRRSIRAFKKKPVDKAVIERLITTSRYAPTARNWQPVHWLVIHERQDVERLSAVVVDWMKGMVAAGETARFPLRLMENLIQDWDRGLDRVSRGAPHVIVAHGPAALPASLTGCLIALTTLELAATAGGLGACWAGYLNICANNHPPMAKALDLPEGHQSFGIMMLGHPRYQYHRVPQRNAAPITWR